MANLKQIVEFLNKELKIKKIKDKWIKNGLNFKGNNKIDTVAFAVDPCMYVFEAAKRKNAQLLITHHGFWLKRKKDITNVTKERLKFLRKNKLSLACYHLPLDAHRKYGNNALLLNLLGAKIKKKFDDCGYEGYFKKEQDINKLVKTINKVLHTKSHALLFGKRKVKTIAVVSGGGAYDSYEAIKKKIDVFWTGDALHSIYNAAAESKINIIFAGHYATETVGVKALMPLIEKKFKVKTIFIDNPTGL
jgi:dinuclear metal center YbgI/SA1388 family protein